MTNDDNIYDMRGRERQESKNKIPPFFVLPKTIILDDAADVELFLINMDILFISKDFATMVIAMLVNAVVDQRSIPSNLSEVYINLQRSFDKVFRHDFVERVVNNCVEFANATARNLEQYGIYDPVTKVAPYRFEKLHNLSVVLTYSERNLLPPIDNH